MVKNIKLTIAYDGTNYHGWQTQSGQETIQETIEKAIYTITRQKVNLYGSGRTDKGVHAIGQTANFIAETKIETDKIKLALNANLPTDIRIIKSEEVDSTFNARFDAKGKTYLYQVYNDRAASPFHSKYTWFVPTKLDLEAMRYASQLIVGTHDFKGFMSAGSDVKTTVRTVYKTQITQEDKIIKFEVTGSGFLYNMVRIIVGTLIGIGNGKKDISCIEQAINNKDRTLLGQTAGPQGLFLKEVYYEENKAKKI